MALLVLGRKRLLSPAAEITQPFVGRDPVLDALRGTVPQAIQDFAQAIAVAEGFGLPDALPTRNHNPGDLVSGGSIAVYADDLEGWRALYRQLSLISGETSRIYTLNDTIGSMARKWTETEQENWAHNVISSLRQLGYAVTVNTPLSEILT